MLYERARVFIRGFRCPLVYRREEAEWKFCYYFHLVPYILYACLNSIIYERIIFFFKKDPSPSLPNLTMRVIYSVVELTTIFPSHNILLLNEYTLTVGPNPSVQTDLLIF